MTAATIAVNIAYALYVGSALVKTETKLRAAMIVVSLAFIVWALIDAQWWALMWNVLFGGSHAYRLIMLWRQHRQIMIADEAELVHQRLFSDLNRLDFYGLWSIGTTREVESGEVLIKSGSTGNIIGLILDGELVVEREVPGAAPVELARLKTDALVGERSYVTGQPASATVRAGAHAVIHEWDQTKMGALRELCPAGHAAVVRHIGVDLAAKLG